MNRFKSYFDKGCDLIVGVVLCGPEEGLYKAELETANQGFIQAFGNTPDEAVDNLYNKLQKHV